MRYSLLAIAALTALWSLPVHAQTSDPAAANQALIGEGPNVTVQQSAIGTLDVGGPGATNPKLTGENLRGNLGASRAQPSTGTTPAAPTPGVPNYSFQAPNFGADLSGAAPGNKPTEQELRIAKDLILPRFRSVLSNSASQRASTHGDNGWRYRYFNGRWWYWQPNSTWAFWDGSQWRQRDSRN